MKTLVRRIAGSAGVCTVGLLSLAGLAGCFDNDPGMQEKLVRTQVELQETKQKLQDTQAALQKAQGASQLLAAATPTPAPTKEQLNDGYIAAAKEMRSQLESELTGYSILNCTLYQVSTVAALPYTSKVAIALRSDKGQQYKLELPVGADTAGKWKFPTTQEILEGIAKNPPKSVASNGQPTGPNSGNSVDGQRPKPFEPRGQEKASTPPPVSGMGDANVETVPLTWSQSQTRSSGQSRSQGSTPVQPPAPASMSTGRAADQRPLAPRSAAPQPPAPQPAAPPSQPTSAMPADQSVLVTF